MKRVLFFLENYRPGGGEKYAADFISCISSFKCERIFVSNPKGISSVIRQNLDQSVTLEEINVITQTRIAEKLEQSPLLLRGTILMLAYLLSPIFYIINIYGFLRLLSRYRPDVVQSFNGSYPGARGCLALLFAARLMGIRAVLTVVGNPAIFLFTERFTGLIRDMLVRSIVNITIVNAESIKRKLIANHGFKEDRILVIYNGIQPCEDKANENRFIDQFRLSKTNNILIGYVARMDFAKGPIYLVEAFRMLISEINNIHLVLVGHGNASKALEDLISEYGLGKDITMTGQYTNNVFDVLKSLDIFVFTSLSEGLPYSILEAMKAGCAIISTNVGGIGEAIRDGVDGLLVPPADVMALKEKIAYLIRFPSERGKLKRNARKRFEDCFNMSVMKTRVERIYDQYVFPT